MRPLQTVALLTLANCFMTYAWYGHLKTLADRPWWIAARLGLGTLLSYALGRLTLHAAIARLGRRVGLVAAPVAARDGLAAIDVDKVQDLADVRRILAERAAYE